MKNISPEELQLHSNVLTTRGTSTLSLLIEVYSHHLLKHLHRYYRKELQRFPHTGSEAVYNSLEWYHEHPRQYLPLQGSLRKFLELKTERHFQQLMERYAQPIHAHRLNQLLAPFFDNERDLQVAKLILKNEHSLYAYLAFIDTATLRFHQMRTEILHLKNRVRIMLLNVPGIGAMRITNLNKNTAIYPSTAVAEYL